MKHSNKNVTMEHDLTTTNCQKVSQVLARIGDKWSVLIVMLLSQQPQRFSEIKRTVNGISQRMLTLCLRGLERDGLVERKVVAVMPPHVEYSLTPLGKSLTQPVIALGNWATENIDEIEAARIAYDLEQGEESATPWQQAK